MVRFELPDRGCQRQIVAAHRGVGFVACGNFPGQVAVRFANCRQAGLERRLRGAQCFFCTMQRGYVTRDGDLADQFAFRIQQRRGLEGDANNFSALLTPLGGSRRRAARADTGKNAGVIGIGEIGGVQLAQWLTDGFLCGVAIQGGSFVVPVRDDRVQVLDDDGFAGVLEHLLELAGVRLHVPILGTSNDFRLDDPHRTRPSALMVRVGDTTHDQCPADGIGVST